MTDRVASDDDEPEDGAPSFRVHWGLVPAAVAGERVAVGSALLAVWPAPVNADECFRAAGFHDFGDADEAWEREAEGLLGRLLGDLASRGAPRLIGPALQPRPRWWARLLGRRAPELPLRDQVLAPAWDDRLPPAAVRFGDAGATLRTGEGHLLFWITLPQAELADFTSAALPRIAAPHPLLNTDLDWKHLLV